MDNKIVFNKDSDGSEDEVNINILTYVLCISTEADVFDSVLDF